MDGQLHRNVEAVQNVASKHQRVLGRINGVDPALGAKYVVDEEETDANDRFYHNQEDVQ